MIKAVFSDFYGTVVHENGPKAFEVIKRVFKNSTAAKPEEVIEYWWKTFRMRLEEANGDAYRLQYDVSLESFKELVSHFQSGESPKELCDMMVEHWCNPPLYEDTKRFMEDIHSRQLPIYFVTNSDDLFIKEAVKNHQLNPDGIFTSEQAKYSKPRREIFLYALEKAHLKPDEIIHIGDSIAGDIKCPESIGIRTIWINRENKPVPEGITAAANLSDAKKLIESIMK
jgi:2-haloalkanoic acid dehalogenase type II